MSLWLFSCSYVLATYSITLSDLISHVYIYHTYMWFDTKIFLVPDHVCSFYPATVLQYLSMQAHPSERPMSVEDCCLGAGLGYDSMNHFLSNLIGSACVNHCPINLSDGISLKKGWMGGHQRSWGYLNNLSFHPLPPLSSCPGICCLVHCAPRPGWEYWEESLFICHFPAQ